MPDETEIVDSIFLQMLPLVAGIELVALYFTWRFYRSIQMLRRQSGKPRTRILHEEEIDVPPMFDRTDTLLQALNLIPLGVEAVQFDYMKQEAYTWVYGSPDEQFHAEVVYGVQAPVQVWFLTCFADDALVMTAFPTGENITDVHFSFHFAHHSIKAALDHHREVIRLWAMFHGEPRSVRQIEDIEYIGDVFRQRYRSRMFRRLLRLHRIGLTLMIGLAGLNGLNLILLPFSNTELMQQLWPMTALIGIGIVIYGIRYSDTLRDPPGAIDEPRGRNHQRTVTVPRQ